MNLTQTYPHLRLRRKPKCIAAAKATASTATAAATASNNSSPNGTSLSKTEYHHTIEREPYLICTSSHLQYRVESYCVIEYLRSYDITRKQ